MDSLLFALWFFLPAGIANTVPVFAARIRVLDSLGIPIDAGRKFRGKRIFGDHKTLRGIIVGVICAVIVIALQMFIFKNSTWIQNVASPVDYSEPIVLLLGVALGFGALIGDAIKSFFKRQMNISSGRRWFPFDQTDYIIGGILFSLPFIVLPPSTYLTILFVWFGLHLVTVYVGWLLHIREDPI